MRREFPCAALLLLCMACGEAVSPVDSSQPADVDPGEDASLISTDGPDAGPTDRDTPEIDAASLDLGEPEPDAGFVDLGTPDLSVPDAAADGGTDGGGDAALAEEFGARGGATTESLTFDVDGTPVECRAPVGSGLRPLVLISHGFLIPHTQYLAFAEHLASWAFVACSVDYTESFSGNHAVAAAEIANVFDEITAGNEPTLVARVDPTKVALMGHSLGGKLSFLVASDRPSVAAVVGLDPVDSAPALCSMQSCPSAIARLPLNRPVLLVGETGDEVRTSILAPACNPADENFDDFYAASGSGTLEVTLTGASHMSFVDDLVACGAICSACQPETGNRSQLVEAIRWFSTGFLLEALSGRTDLEPALRGGVAESRFVTPGRVGLRDK